MQRTKMFAVELIDCCRDVEEVETVLKRKKGSKLNGGDRIFFFLFLFFFSFVVRSAYPESTESVLQGRKFYMKNVNE